MSCQYYWRASNIQWNYQLWISYEQATNDISISYCPTSCQGDTKKLLLNYWQAIYENVAYEVRKNGMKSEFDQKWLESDELSTR